MDRKDDYPTEPNYDLFSAKSADPVDSVEPEESVETVVSDKTDETTTSAVKVRVSPKHRNTLGVILLCTIASLLLLVVLIGSILIIRNAVIVPDRTMPPPVDLQQTDNSPFERPETTTSATTPVTTGISINDPPVVGTTPVESNGVLSVSEIAKLIQPSVVSVLVNNSYSSGLASGVVMTAEGLILTNYHVVEGMTDITVVRYDGVRYNADLIGYDASCDLAILFADGAELIPATFGNSDALEVGDLAVAIGTPYSLSLSGTTTQGIISAINRDLLVNNRPISLIQTDASINPGNSGGPLINEFGQVIGIISMKIGEDFEGLGFAIPMNTAKELVERILNGENAAATPAFGFDGHFLTETTASANGLPVGFYVTAVHPASDAYAQGVQEGDVIVAIDGVMLADLAALTSLKNTHVVGEIAVLYIYRDTNPYDNRLGSYGEISVVLMDQALFNH